MFKSKNFCHIASNNRNQVKVGVFTYRTTDSLATVLANGYFNERIIDINLHDLIIHEKIDALDNTKVVRNLLCVTERTLENVGTSVVKSDWEGDIEQAIADLRTYVNNNFVNIDGTSVMTGPLLMRATPDFKCAVAPYWDGIGFFKLNDNNSVTLMASLEYEEGLTPATDNKYNFGTSTKRWKDARIARVITGVVNNGYDIAVPVTNSADTLALKSEVDTAANSGDQLYSTGVWYAKMYAATVVPTGAEYDGRNYADFSQVDSDNNPIIVIYTGASGAWTETTRITPPTAYNGYMTITSKIWDISEQSGQQGGKVLWSHNQKTFTPYPQIISFENAALTGVPTAPLPTNASPNNQIATKEYVDNSIPSGNSTKSIDTEIIGSLTVAENGDVSGTWNFNTGYLKHPCNLDFTGASSFEIVIVATTSSTTGAVFSLQNTESLNKGMYFNTENNKLHAVVGDGTNYQEITGTTSLTSNTKYYTKLTYDGTSYTLALSTDGISYTTEATAVAQYIPKYNNYETKLLLNSGGSILHASECYIKKDTILVWNGLDAPGLHQRVAKGHEVIEFQAPTALNNYTWYRKYADGWVEQGGEITSSTANDTINLLVEMADTHYFTTVHLVSSQAYSSSTATLNINGCNTLVGTINRRGTTSFYISYPSSTDGRSYMWEVKGMAQG